MASPQRTALVVETNYLIASGIEAPLVAAGYEVLIATSPEEALDHIERRAPEIAFLDFRLEHGHPDGLVPLLTARNVPFVFCTAATPDEVTEAFPEAHIVSKPFSEEDLLAAVTALSAGAASPPEREHLPSSLGDIDPTRTRG